MACRIAGGISVAARQAMGSTLGVVSNVRKTLKNSFAKVTTFITVLYNYVSLLVWLINMIITMVNREPEKINIKPFSYDEDDAARQMKNRKSSSNYEEDAQQMNAAFFFCKICIEKLPLHQKFENKPTSSLAEAERQLKLTKTKQKINRKTVAASSASPPCGHQFCTDCIARYIEFMVQINENADIKCPDTNCASVLDPLSCRSFLHPKVFVRWCDYLCQSTVRERYDTAYCPNPYCSELVSSDCKQRLGHRYVFWIRWLTRSKHKITECPHCRLSFCLRCMVLCQDNRQCSYNGGNSIRVKRANEVLFMKMVKRNKWARCPSCKYYVEKKSGCFHITCRCKYEFCYSCGVKWRQPHGLHCQAYWL